VAPGKVADFAGEAAAQDIDTLSRYEEAKRLALVACLVHTARMRARDDLAEMLCKRVAAIVKKARTELEEIRLRQRADQRVRDLAGLSRRRPSRRVRRHRRRRGRRHRLAPSPDYRQSRARHRQPGPGRRHPALRAR
jgi:hypothetical protein